MSFHFHPALQVEKELYGNAILTSLPVRLIQAGSLPSGPTFEPRGALWTAVKADEAEIQIITTHLSFVASERLVQVDALLGAGWIGALNCRDPVILLGDFNAVRRSVAYGRLAARLQDAQLRLHHRPRSTFPTRMPMLRIDHIFCSRAVEVLRVEVPRSRLVRSASDHLPLVVDFRLLDGK